MEVQPNLESGPPTYFQSNEPWYDEAHVESSETTPLIRRHNLNEEYQKDVRTLWTHLFYVPLTIAIASLLAILIYRACAYDPLSDRAQKDMRERWEWEEKQHEKKVLEWKHEIAKYERQESDLMERLGVIRSEIELKKQENSELEREALALEGRARRAEVEERSAKQRLDDYERKLREEREERAKMRLYWDDLRADDQCLGHNQIHYRALLANVLPTIDVVDACKATSITINGLEYQSPEWCEDVGNNNVYGHWIVHNEGKCSSYWEYFKDKGCTAPGSRTRRFEAPLAGITPGQNQERLCHTTPATILGHQFDGPHSCPYWGSHGFWGIWDVRDDRCA